MKEILALMVILGLTLCGCAQPQRTDTAQKNDLASMEARAKSAPYDWDNQLALASRYFRDGKYPEAIEAYKKTYGGKSPFQETQAWYFIAQAYRKMGQYDAAIIAQKRSIELNPGNAENYIYLAGIYYSSKKYDDTIAAAKQAIAIQPTLWTAHHYLGAALNKKGQYADALAALKRASELAPKEAGNYGLIGESMLEQYRFAEAAAYYQKAIELASQEAVYYNGAAVAFYRAGRYDDAIVFATKALERVTIIGLGITVDNEKTSGGIIVASVRSGLPGQKAGILAQDRVTEINGISTQGMDVKTFVGHARGALGTSVVLTITREAATLQKTIARESIVDPIGALYLSTRSLSHGHKGESSRALEDALRALELAPRDLNAAVALASAYLKQGQSEKALQAAQSLTSARGQLVKATAQARLSRTAEAVAAYVAINQAEIPDRVVPVAADRKDFFEEMRPYVAENRNRAAVLDSKGQHREALAAYSEALKVADEADAQAILSACFVIVRKNPAFGQVSEEARRYAIRSETLVKQGSFADGLVEIRKAINEAPYIAQFYYNAAIINAEMKQHREAIRDMKVYLAAAPDSPHARAAKDEIIKWELAIERGK